MNEMAPFADGTPAPHPNLPEDAREAWRMGWQYGHDAGRTENLIRIHDLDSKIRLELMSWRHETCEDNWYSCAQAVESDWTLSGNGDTTPGSGCADESRAGQPCDCGLDARRARILALLVADHGGVLR